MVILQAPALAPKLQLATLQIKANFMLQLHTCLGWYNRSDLGRIETLLRIVPFCKV